MSGEDLYRDKVCVLDADGITLLRYYFPTAQSKRIAYSDIRHVERSTMGPLTGKGRAWGTGDFTHYNGLDLHRASKDVLFTLDLGQHIQPTVAPEDPERVAALLRGRVAGFYG